MKCFQILAFIVLSLLIGCIPKNLETQKPIRVEEGIRVLPSYDLNSFSTVENDPLKVRAYTLKNGLKVFLTVNKEAPRIQTQVSVRAGGKHDPANATGLAHYLEHLLFKGTSKLGTIDYKKEKIELDKITLLYESYRQTKDSLERAIIYHKIDSISGVASKFACLNEFDQAHSILGATGTNAYTTHDNTSYITNIPSNQLKFWLELESERFMNPVLRLFHTELEAVYEEKNRSQDNHFRQQYYVMLRGLFKKHNYGLQTTIGTIDHLKNPSIVEIKKFFKHYYVPNNMAIILSGDFNPDSAITYIKSTFGAFESSPINEYRFEHEDSIIKHEEFTLKAPDASSLLMAYRLPKAGSKSVYLARMTDMILNNSKAGLIDLNINQQQKAVGVYSGVNVSADYSYHILGGSPTTGQTLKELQALINAQIELVKKGDFPDWLIPAIINDFKVRELKALQSNKNRVGAINDAFVHGLNWEQKSQDIAILASITKEEVIEFANKFYADNYVAVYKEQTDEVLSRLKVKKPGITPLDIPEGNKSDFLRSFIDYNNPNPIEPSFINYKKEVNVEELFSGVPLNYSKNIHDELFSLQIVFPIGTYHDANLKLAAQQISLLSTDKFSAGELSQEMYKLGMAYAVSVGQKETTISLSGLGSQLDTSFTMLNNILNEIIPNQEVLNGLVQKTIQVRQNQLKNPKSILWNGMQNFAVYGDRSPLKSQLSNEQLLKTTSIELVNSFKAMIKIKPQVLFYGESSIKELRAVLSNSFVDKANSENKLEIEYERKNMDETEILVLDYDLKQSEILLLSKGSTFKKSELAANKVFNEYYGGGMSSVIFQEIREKKALAYSSFAVYTTAKDSVKPQYTYGYLGCQTDKSIEAIEALLSLLKDMPEDSIKFEQAKSALKQQLSSSRTTRAGKLSSYWADQKLGFETSKGEMIYNSLDALQFEDVIQFHKERISKNNYTILIISNLKELDLEGLKRYGKVEIISVEDLYPY